MTKGRKSIVIILSLVLFTAACSTTSASTAKDELSAYQEVLGRSAMDDTVVNFLSDHECVAAMQFHVCKDSGMALWTDSGQIVKSVWLYANNSEGFNRYRGKLPFGLTFYDPMWLVEQKLSTVELDETSQATYEAGLPDEGSSPDHLHYWAVYERLGLIVIYDFPYPDDDAYIYAVVVKT
jgi:hypothetical protein